MMNSTGRKDVPLAWVALIFGCLSVPLAFGRHLVSLAVVLAALAIALGSWGRWKARRTAGLQGTPGAGRALWAMRTGVVGLACAVLMWWLWAKSVLLN